MRKLFVAISGKEKIHIDNVLHDDSRTFFCPYCSKEVTPKIGDIKEKHFAHKDGFCGVELDAGKEEQGKEIKLTSFSTSDKDPFEKKITPKSLVRCRICGDNLRLENAVIVSDNKFICRKCIPRIREIML